MSNITPINISNLTTTPTVMPFEQAEQFRASGIQVRDTGIDAAIVGKKGAPIPLQGAADQMRPSAKMPPLVSTPIGRFWGIDDETREDASSPQAVSEDGADSSIKVEAVGLETNSKKKNQYIPLKAKKEKKEDASPQYYFSPDTYHKVPESQITSYYPINIPISLQ